MNIRDFYIKCHYGAYPDMTWDKQYRALINKLMDDFGKKGSNRLTSGQRTLINSGNCYKVQIRIDKEASSPAPCNLKDFFKNVYADPTAKASLTGMYEEMISRYGGALTDDQKKVIMSGDPKKISDQLTAENNNTPPSMTTIVNPEVPVITWMVTAS